MTGFSLFVRELIWCRDQGCCARCGQGLSRPRSDTYDMHHRRPRGSGGTTVRWVNLPANGVLLCTRCHALVEAYRNEARDEGYLVRLNGRLTASEVPLKHALHGWVLLHDDGKHTRTDAP